MKKVLLFILLFILLGTAISQNHTVTPQKKQTHRLRSGLLGDVGSVKIINDNYATLWVSNNKNHYKYKVILAFTGASKKAIFIKSKHAYFSGRMIDKQKHVFYVDKKRGVIPVNPLDCYCAIGDPNTDINVAPNPQVTDTVGHK